MNCILLESGWTDNRLKMDSIKNSKTIEKVNRQKRVFCYIFGNMKKTREKRDLDYNR